MTVSRRIRRWRDIFPVTGKHLKDLIDQKLFEPNSKTQGSRLLLISNLVGFTFLTVRLNKDLFFSWLMEYIFNSLFVGHRVFVVSFCGLEWCSPVESRWQWNKCDYKFQHWDLRNSKATHLKYLRAVTDLVLNYIHVWEWVGEIMTNVVVPTKLRTALPSVPNQTCFTEAKQSAVTVINVRHLSAPNRLKS